MNNECSSGPRGRKGTVSWYHRCNHKDSKHLSNNEINSDRLVRCDHDLVDEVFTLFLRVNLITDNHNVNSQYF